MANYPYILFNKSPEQLRRQGAHGGRTFGRNHKARLARMTSPPQPVAPPVPLRETTAQAIALLNSQFWWLRGSEKRVSP